VIGELWRGVESWGCQEFRERRERRENDESEWRRD